MRERQHGRVPTQSKGDRSSNVGLVHAHGGKGEETAQAGGAEVTRHTEGEDSQNSRRRCQHHKRGVGGVDTQ